MPFVLFLALLASVTAAPTTKDRRANEQPKVRLVVTGETNVARTTRGARASNRVAQMARGGNVTMSYSYPASYPSIMSVAATDSSDAKASFSQFNDEVDIAAPGVDVVSTVGPPSDTGVGPPGYDSYDGTSMAAPHVSGLAMVLWNK
ncbi:hypothetical protein EMIHUDRAFT_254306 [Emiliania huxleyi CCMP1516]|uniref:Peptidase S8/S53 domain-containing protein n=2 Tax=Emiliania huxleyi TaxID=2903 RepID=A0A0D3JV85_EMIH1|nr:hypothetical protein EMIHUDRAFT_254306 [Emiliania huxleyi CCMP1516]EOD27420.1 hypothetical protein EMIHUDRAFT_254306 [Emiliania huxleyi CCMP1516]|eukprot:XP_005779849.1 hypothetical protein EMIHUDRAFT_254306 [Emiliania huxleyi CCMP1516]